MSEIEVGPDYDTMRVENLRQQVRMEMDLDLSRRSRRKVLERLETGRFWRSLSPDDLVAMKGEIDRRKRANTKVMIAWFAAAAAVIAVMWFGGMDWAFAWWSGLLAEIAVP